MAQYRLVNAFKELLLARNLSLPEKLRVALNQLWDGLGEQDQQFDTLRQLDRQKAVQLVGKLLVVHDKFICFDAN